MPAGKPRTQAQIEASRRNGAKSRGPKTAAGRAASSRNALKHGARAQVHFFLNSEDPAGFQEMLEGYLRAYAPATEPERQLVLEIAHSAWRLQRLTGIEVSLFNQEIRKNQKHMDRTHPKRISPEERIALAFSSLASESRELENLLRYAAAARRRMLSATSALLRLRKPTRLAELPKKPEEPSLDPAKPLQSQDILTHAAARVPDLEPGCNSKLASFRTYAPPICRARHVTTRFLCNRFHDIFDVYPSGSNGASPRPPVRAY